MGIEKLTGFVKSGYYWPAVAATSVGIGVAVGFAVDRISAKIEERRTCPLEDPHTWRFGMDDDGDEDFSLPFPEGVNIVDQDKVDKVVNDEIFVKPDIAKMRDYTKYANAPGKHAKSLDPEEGEEISEDGGEMVVDVLDDDRFEIISEQEFVHEVGNENGYVSATGTYFTQDGILAGWNDDLVEKDILNTVGMKAISAFDQQSTKAVYVRNDQLKVLYEIVRCDDPMEDVLRENEEASVDAIQEDSK